MTAADKPAEEEGLLEERLHEHYLTLVVRTPHSYLTTMAQVLSAALSVGAKEARGYDHEKRQAEHRAVVEERNAAIVALHEIECRLEALQVAGSRGVEDAFREWFTQQCGNATPTRTEKRAFCAGWTMGSAAALEGRDGRA